MPTSPQRTQSTASSSSKPRASTRSSSPAGRIARPTPPTSRTLMAAQRDRKSVVEGKSVSVRVDFGGRRIIKKKTRVHYNRYPHSYTDTAQHIIKLSTLINYCTSVTLKQI